MRPQCRYDKCPRALIFGRDAPGVNDTDSMATIMRYNDYQQDPFSREGCGVNPPSYPAEAVASRADLAPVNVRSANAALTDSS